MIYKQCVLTIANNTATLDEDIYLYRLDKNVELYFTIVNNKYRFDKSDLNNIIARTNASYFQMRLYKNAQVKYTFPLQPTEDGKAILTITNDLIDEPIEVGDYDFQISLLDSDKSSMISMPIASKQLHVCEPLVDVVNESTIDTAAIDTASVLATDEAELPVVDSTGKYIPTVWDTGDTISKAKINHIEKGILQAHTDALNNKIPKVTPPKGQTTSDIVTLYNALPDNGSVYLTEPYSFNDNVMVGYLCEVATVLNESTGDTTQTKMLTCGVTGMYVYINAGGYIEGSGICNPQLDEIVGAIENPDRKKGQVLTMGDNNRYGWGDAIPHITPPKGQTSSDIIKLYNMLPNDGLVYLTEGAMIQNAGLIGLCSVYFYTSSERDLSADNVKSITCYNTGVCIEITSTGQVVSKELTNTDLSDLMKVLRDSTRKKGQVLTMLEDTVYGWSDLIPQVTPPPSKPNTSPTTSELVTFYNELPDSGSVYITEPYYLDEEGVVVEYLCDIKTSNEDEPYKIITCGATGTNVVLSSTGDLLDCILCEPHLNQLIQSIENPSRKKGQVLTVTDNHTYHWADTTPKLYIHHSAFESSKINLTLDPYQEISIAETSGQESSTCTKVLELPTISDEDRNNMYQIHVMLRGRSDITYSLPAAYYDKLPDGLKDNVPYEFIFTCIYPGWVGTYKEYTIKHLNEPK